MESCQRSRCTPKNGALDSSPRHSAGRRDVGEKNNEGHHVGLDFYDLLAEALIGGFERIGDFSTTTNSDPIPSSCALLVASLLSGTDGAEKQNMEKGGAALPRSQLRFYSPRDIRVSFDWRDTVQYDRRSPKKRWYRF